MLTPTSIPAPPVPTSAGAGIRWRPGHEGRQKVLASPEQPNRLYIIVYLVFIPAMRQTAIRKPCCSDGTGGQGQDRGCRRRVGNRQLGCPCVGPGSGAERDGSSVPTCQQLLTRLGNAAQQPGVQEMGSGVRWQQPDLCGNAVHEGRRFAPWELPARGAVPYWALEAGRKTQGPSCCSLSCLSHWVGTAWKPPRIKVLPRSSPRYTRRSILRWELRRG